MTPDLAPYPYADVVARIRGEKWSRRQDSTLDQLRDLFPVAVALGCRDAADHLRRYVDRCAVLDVLAAEAQEMGFYDEPHPQAKAKEPTP